MSGENRKGVDEARAQMKRIVLAAGAVESGNTTSAAVAEATGMSLRAASARLSELAMMGLIQRVRVSERNGKGTRGGGGAIEWKPKAAKGGGW